MQRRQFIGTTLAASVALFGAGARQPRRRAAAPLPKRDQVKVAFMLGEWTQRDRHRRPVGGVPGHRCSGGWYKEVFELYTVAPTDGMLAHDGRTPGQAPLHDRERTQPNVIVVPAHGATADSRDVASRGELGHGRHDLRMHRRLPARQSRPPRKASRRRRITSSGTEFAKEFPDIELAPRPALRRQRPHRDRRRPHVRASTWRCTSWRATSASRSRPARREYMEYTSDAWRA